MSKADDVIAQIDRQLEEQGVAKNSQEFWERRSKLIAVALGGEGGGVIHSTTPPTTEPALQPAEIEGGKAIPPNVKAQLDALEWDFSGLSWADAEAIVATNSPDEDVARASFAVLPAMARRYCTTDLTTIEGVGLYMNEVIRRFSEAYARATNPKN